MILFKFYILAKQNQLRKKGKQFLICHNEMVRNTHHLLDGPKQWVIVVHNDGFIHVLLDGRQKEEEKNVPFLGSTSKIQKH